MCGVIGVAGENCLEQVRGMLDRIAHRGPDDSGVYADDHLTLGHCRLAIIDPAHGQQPFTTENGRYVLSFNGEIYNYRDLAARLHARGVNLKSNSDTETLAYWFQEFGIDGLADLDGMFAFAIWDRQTRRLVLARDRFGIKPMYTARVGRKLVFGSEIKAMLPWIERKPNHRAIAQFLTFQNVLTEETFFAGVEKLEPGGWVEWRPDGFRSGQFWSLAFPEDPQEMSLGPASERFAELFDASVDRHLISDVPVGSYVSGGIDSGSVATRAAAKRPGDDFPVFTGAFTDRPYYDERDGARAVAANIGASLQDIVITPQMFETEMRRVMWHLDEPTLGTGAIPQFIVSRLAAEHVKVVLTGHGGDELFAGYQVNKAFQIRDGLRHGPVGLFRALSSVRPDELTRVLYYLM
ncbi:MAG: asparagine synthase (glutamine-hydrolyzing), partial [Alphaproteobacteria bacterium]